MPKRSTAKNDWTAIIGRSLAMIAMEEAGLIGKSIAKQARFLEAIGLTRGDVAELLGTTPSTLTAKLTPAPAKRTVMKKPRTATRRKSRKA